MSQLNNTLLTVAKLSMLLSRRCMSRYSHIKSPHKFTQPQLVTCLVLRAYLKTTYRGVIEFLATAGQLRQAMGLDRLPHYSTLKKFADRPGVAEVIDAMLGQIAQVASADEDDTEIAIDSTGIETSSASTHYQSRAGRRRSQYVKLSLAVICGSLLPAGLVVDWGPTNDKVQARALLDKTRRHVAPATLFADAGYDAEWVHEYCRDDWGVESWIKPARHRTDGTFGGHYRSRMTKRRLKRRGYGRRWHVESFISGLKRTMGSTLNARKPAAMFIEAAARVLAYACRR